MSKPATGFALHSPLAARLQADNVDVTNTVTCFPALSLVKTSHSNTLLGVAAPGQVFSATFRNNGDTTTNVNAVVDEDTSGAFGVSVCSAGTTSADCLASSAKKLSLTIKPGKTVIVKVGVRYPSAEYDYSPYRGVSLQLLHSYEAWGVAVEDYVPLAGTTKALWRKP